MLTPTPILIADLASQPAAVGDAAQATRDLLDWAVQADSPSRLQGFLDKGADPQAVDSNGHSALMRAIRKGNFRKALAVLPLSDADHRVSRQEAPLALALALRDPARLVAGISAPTPSFLADLALFLASSEQNAPSAQHWELIALAAIRDDDAETLEKIASHCDLRGGVVVRGRHASFLAIAAAETAPKSVSFLLTTGSDPMARDAEGANALMALAARGAPQASSRDATPPVAARYAQNPIDDERALECARLLLGACDTEAQDQEGRTALMLAASHAWWGIFRLIAAKSDVNVQSTADGSTVLMRVIGHVGVRPENKQRRGYKEEQVLAIQALAPRADFSLRDHSGFTTIQWALESRVGSENDRWRNLEALLVSMSPADAAIAAHAILVHQMPLAAPILEAAQLHGVIQSASPPVAPNARAAKPARALRRV